MRDVTDPRLLRAFLVVAEELHFTRAAARLFVAQQTLSRDIQRLEQAWGRVLFVRDTRHVTLTAEGSRLLPTVRRVLAAHGELSRELRTTPGSGSDRPLVVDVANSTSTGTRVLDLARRDAPGLDFVLHTRSGLTRAVAEMADGHLDVSFGRVAGIPHGPRGTLEHRLIRFDQLAVMVPTDHRLAALPRVPLAALAGETLYAAAGNEDTAEWTDYARSLCAGRAIELAPPYPKIEGEVEFSRTMRRNRWLVLTSLSFMTVPEMVLRPLTDPVPLTAVSMVWRRSLRHPGVKALADAARTLGAAEGWLERPPGSWLPETDLRVVERPHDSAGAVEGPDARRPR
ncbi:LysR family transcriptional regulator [Streptomyces sp. CB00455]|uniref:LysR family transcriptional regulator n=1 Tax=Streptomyces sp. CB00455 TaxID=1703927 RepID=UPI00093F21E7|nr:LysR family transcriptional regulator [Streptomyces sp. CB00455]OKK16134.1 LysR family transcriptional regulator [Streptomyces sp. CB00455]